MKPTNPPAEIENPEKLCKGECVSGLFALFCDEIDSDAFCPTDTSCCISSGGDSDDVSEEKEVTTRRPAATQVSLLLNNIILCVVLACEWLFSDSYGELFQASLPSCPGFCMLNIMAAFCERPAVVIAKTSNCKSGSICCDNTKYGEQVS